MKLLLVFSLSLAACTVGAMEEKKNTPTGIKASLVGKRLSEEKSKQAPSKPKRNPPAPYVYLYFNFPGGAPEFFNDK